MRCELTHEQQRLVVQYIPLARKLARSYRRAWPHYADEFDSDAMLALVQAAVRFDPERGVMFHVFARARIIGALKDKHLIIASPPRNSVACDVESVAVTVRVETGIENREFLDAVMRFLPRIQRKIARFVDRAGFTQVEARRYLLKGQHRVQLSATTLSVYRQAAQKTMRRYAPLIQDANLLRSVLSRLPIRQALAFRLTCIEGMTRVAAGKSMGIKHQNVTRLRRKAILKVNAYFDESQGP